MATPVTVRIPNIGDFEEVDVVEILVQPGDRVEVEDSLIVLESDKATMEIPSPIAGEIGELLVAVGDAVGEGSPICTLNPTREVGADQGGPRLSVASERSLAAPPGRVRGDRRADVVVLGGGPGGYTAAFRVADLGLRVILVERYPTLGGVCLNVGCIPSKTLLHLADVINQARELADHGVRFGDPELDLDRIRRHKNAVVNTLTRGLARLADQRRVEVVTGVGGFASPHLLAVETPDGPTTVSFDHAVIAAGSQAAHLPGLPVDDPRIMDSTAALELPEIPPRLLVIGGGIIGLEMTTLFGALGSRVTVVEVLEELLPEAGPDLVRPLRRHLEGRGATIYLETRVVRVETEQDGLRAFFDGKEAPPSDLFDRVLVAVGRRPNGPFIGADKAGVVVDEHGFIPADERQRTNVPHIYAIGDIIGPPLLAHKATHQGKVAAEVIAGLPSAFDARTIPSVAYTDPEVAWMGQNEDEARKRNIPVKKVGFPWAASGRALGLGRNEGTTQLVFCTETGRLLGAGIVGPGAGELIAETVLALELGADAEDIARSIHPHPSLSETVALAAEVAHGSVTDLAPAKRRGAKGNQSKPASSPPAKR